MHNIDEQEDIAVVVGVNIPFVTVELAKKGACKSCGMSSFCMGKNSSVTHTIKTMNNFKVGDKVKIHISPRFKLFSSFIVFVFPILLMMMVYLLSYMAFELSEKISVILSMSSLLLSGLIIYFIDKKWAKKISINIVEKV